MANECSDIIAINSDDDEPAPDIDKPVIQLFKRLINDDNKQGIFVTNAQIVDILDKDFAINLRDNHELEREIYLTLMKKYLRDWPQWNEFDKTIDLLKTKNDQEALKKMLESNYQNLKDYLKVMLDRVMLDQAQALAKGTVNKTIEDKRSNVKIQNEKDRDDDVVLEMSETTT